MKKLIIAGILLLTQNAISAIGVLTNNSSVNINIVMYNNYIAPTEKTSARGRLNGQGIIIPPGNNASFLPNTTSVDIFYGDGDNSGIHSIVNSNFSYTVYPHEKIWILTQDQN